MKQVLRGVMQGVCVIAFGLGAFFIGSGTTGSAAATYEARDVEVYDNSETDVRTMSCLFRDDMPNIPYVSVEEWLELTFPGMDYHVEKSGDKYRVYGTREGYTGSDMIIDPEAETVTFDNMLSFFVGSNSEVLTEEQLIGVILIREDLVPEIYDLSRYGIDLYARDGKVYFPVHTLSDMLSISYSYPDYIDGKIYLARLDGTLFAPEFIEKIEAGTYETTSRAADVADYAYREFCFLVDCRYGKPAKGRSQEFIERIKKNGLDATLEAGGMIDSVDLKKVKTYLTSHNLAEYAAGVMQIDYLLFDGGHTNTSWQFLLKLYLNSIKKFSEEFEQLTGEDKSALSAYDYLKRKYSQEENMDTYYNDREKGLKKPVKTWKLTSGEVIAQLFISENTAVFSFDYFMDNVIKMPSGEKPFIEALEFAKKKKCGNFVVDITCNGGGTLSPTFFMLSFLTEKPIYDTQKNSYTGAVRQVMIVSDRNMDGEFDEEDQKVRYDFHYAVMCSGCSYSSANLFSSIAKDVGIPLLGEKSGGGGNVNQFFGIPGNGGTYSFATCNFLCNEAFEEIDAGIEVDYPMVKKSKDGKLDASMLFNPYQITKTVNQHYGISQKKNPMQLKVVKKTVRATKVSKKKQTVKKALQVTNAKGTVTIQKVGGSKKLTISEKGVITVKKGTKSGTYKLRVKVSTEGTGIYKKASKTVIVTLKVA